MEEQSRLAKQTENSATLQSLAKKKSRSSRTRNHFLGNSWTLKKSVFLNHLPESYRPAAVLVNEANDRAAAAEAELAALKAEMAQKEAERGPAEEPAEAPADPKPFEEWDYKELQAWAKDHGVENVNVKKAELVKACKAITGADE